MKRVRRAIKKYRKRDPKISFLDVLPEQYRYHGKTLKEVILIDPEYATVHIKIDHLSIPKEYASILRKTRKVIQKRDVAENQFKRIASEITNRSGLYAEEVLL